MLSVTDIGIPASGVAKISQTRIFGTTSRFIGSLHSFARDRECSTLVAARATALLTLLP